MNRKKIVVFWLMIITLSANLPAEQTSSSANYKLTQQSATSLPSVVAKVNHVEISFNLFWQRLLNNAGNTVLTAIADEILVEQEFDKFFGSKSEQKREKKKKLSSAAKKIELEVEKRYSNLRKQFQDEKTFQQQLKSSGLSTEDVKKQLRLDLYKWKLLENKTKVSENEIKKYFDENRQQLATPEQLHLKHILVASEQEGNDIILALKVGANFESLAKEKSLDNSTKDRGGDLGFFTPDILIPEIKEKVLSMQPGETKAIKSASGFNVIKVVERKSAKEASFDSGTKEKIKETLKQTKFNQEYPPLIQSLRSKADIQVLLNQ